MGVVDTTRLAHAEAYWLSPAVEDRDGPQGNCDMASSQLRSIKPAKRRLSLGLPRSSCGSDIGCSSAQDNSMVSMRTRK